MSDPPDYPEPDDTGSPPDGESTPSTPRWLKMSAIMAIVVVVLVVVLLVAVGGHGPGRH